MGDPGSTSMKTYEGIAEINEQRSRADLHGDMRGRPVRDWYEVFRTNVDHEHRHPGTGTWFVKSSIFTAWLTEENSFLWLNGLAGTGKTVLSSVAIEYAHQQRKLNPQIGVAYFFLDYRHQAKQDISAILGVLVLQLSYQLQDYDSYSASVPPSAGFAECLRRIIQRFEQVYIVLDGLDESPPFGTRAHILQTIGDMQNWSLPGLHLLVSSRDEPDIRHSLQLSIDQGKRKEVQMRDTEIEKDIMDFISWSLCERNILSRWGPSFSEKLKQELDKHAQVLANFRWVDSLLRDLRHFPLSENYLELLLEIPEPQDEKYQQIISGRNIKTKY